LSGGTWLSRTNPSACFLVNHLGHTNLGPSYTPHPRIYDLMSAEDPVIAAPNETSGPERVDSSPIPPSEYVVVKDVSAVEDVPSVDSLTEPPAQPAQTAPDDTHSILPMDDTNIPSSTPTDPNGSTDGVEATTFVSVELLNFVLPFTVPRMIFCPFDTVFT
jgi:hypothetical protein